MERKIFTSHSDRYAQNITDGHTLEARAAWLSPPSGGREPGIAIMTNNAPRTVVPISDALKLAHQLADIIDAHNNQTEQA